MQPLPEPDDSEWHEYEADEATHVEPPQESVDGAGPSMPRPSRMCTVSHCREVLPPDYQYLRCDRHRLQNRHHSKLKRVRDKEVKAAAFSHWIVSVGGHKSEATPGPDNGPIPEEEHGRSYDQEGTPGTGFPPAARGMRRANHVCIIKACFNLLSPTNPWRMCDMCRAKDRAHRREKALRANEPITSEGDGANQEQEEDGEKPKKPKKKKKKKKTVEAAAVVQEPTGSMDEPVPDAQQSEPQGAELIFMSPLLPSQVCSVLLELGSSLIALRVVHPLSRHLHFQQSKACNLPTFPKISCSQLTCRLRISLHLPLVPTQRLLHPVPSRSSPLRRSPRRRSKPKAPLHLQKRNGR